jgi:hypothetical protein
MNMKIFWVLAAAVFSSTAFAEDVPKIGSKPLVQAKPKGPTGCKMVGTVKGTKLWAGDCTVSETSNAPLATDPQPSLPAQITGAIPANQKP